MCQRVFYYPPRPADVLWGPDPKTFHGGTPSRCRSTNAVHSEMLKLIEALIKIGYLVDPLAAAAQRRV